MIFSQASLARMKGTGGSSGSSTPIIESKNPAPTTSAPMISQKATSGDECSGSLDKEKTFPLAFFNQISSDELSGPKFEVNPDNTVKVKFPNMIRSCGKFQVSYIQDPQTKDILMLINLDEATMPVKRDKITGAPLKSGEKYKATYSDYMECLKTPTLKWDGALSKAMFSPEGKPADDIEPENFSSYEQTFSYDYNKSKDLKKSMKLSFGYSKSYDNSGSYPPAWGLDKTLDQKGCMLSQLIHKSTTYVHEGEDSLLEKLQSDCRSGNAQKIAEARRSIGNAEPLKDIAQKLEHIFDAAYLIEAKKEVEDLYAKMKNIEEKISAQKDTMEEKEAKKLVKEYASLAKSLNEKFLNPAILRLDELLKEREKISTSDDKALEAIDAQIQKLNEDIGAFAARKSAFAGLYSVMEKYSIEDSAKTIEDIRLKSLWYGRVFAGSADAKRGKPISLETANKNQVNGLQKFDKVLTDWSDQYLVKSGNTFPIRKTQSEKSMAYNRMEKRRYDFQNKEESNRRKYCAIGFTGSPRNPVQCQAWMSGTNARLNAELGRRKKDLLFIKSRDEKLGKMGAGYSEYERRKVASDTAIVEDDSPYGGSYSSYENTFEDSFPEFNEQPGNNQYNPMNFNMGQQQGMMGPQQNMGMMGPGMYNPQMPIQQGQYQMAQWPGMN